MLLPGLAPPPTRRCLREVFEQKLVASCGGMPKQIAAGPASIHIILAYPGTGAPRVIDLPKPRQLGERLAKSVPGAAGVRWGGSDGTFDVYVDTTDAASANEAVAAAVRELRLERDVIVETWPSIGFARDIEVL
jgi:hypothetical protein